MKEREKGWSGRMRGMIREEMRNIYRLVVTKMKMSELEAWTYKEKLGLKRA